MLASIAKGGKVRLTFGRFQLFQLARRRLALISACNSTIRRTNFSAPMSAAHANKTSVAGQSPK